MTEPLLRCEHLVRRFRDRVAVDDVSFEIARGEIYGLLGPNGAGKTTTISIVAGILQPDEGTITVAGRPLTTGAGPAKQLIGLVPQDIALYPDLTATENLQFFGRLQNLDGRRLAERIGAVLHVVGLTERAGDRVDDYSGGMKRRANIAVGLLHEPRLLILDEPTVGVDPQSRNAIFDNLETLAARGKAIVYTTHYMEEAERLADRIVIIDHGRVVASDTPVALIRALGDTGVITLEVSGAVDVASLRDEAGVSRVEQTDDVLTLALADLGLHLPAVLAWLAARGHAIRRISSSRATLEDVFLSLTGRQLRD